MAPSLGSRSSWQDWGRSQVDAAVCDPNELHTCPNGAVRRHGKLSSALDVHTGLIARRQQPWLKQAESVDNAATAHWAEDKLHRTLALRHEGSQGLQDTEKACSRLSDGRNAHVQARHSPADSMGHEACHRCADDEPPSIDRGVMQCRRPRSWWFEEVMFEQSRSVAQRADGSTPRPCPWSM